MPSTAQVQQLPRRHQPPLRTLRERARGGVSNSLLAAIRGTNGIGKLERAVAAMDALFAGQRHVLVLDQSSRWSAAQPSAHGATDGSNQPLTTLKPN